MNLTEDIEHDGCVIHQPVVSALHEIDLTPLRAHSLFQPSDGTLADPFILIAVPDSIHMRVFMIGESPRNVIVVQDQEKVVVNAFRGFNVREAATRALAKDAPYDVPSVIGRGRREGGDGMRRWVV